MEHAGVCDTEVSHTEMIVTTNLSLISDFLVHVSNKILITDCDQNREVIISDYTGVIIIECSKRQQLNNIWSPGKISFYKRRQKKVFIF